MSPLLLVVNSAISQVPDIFISPELLVEAVTVLATAFLISMSPELPVYALRATHLTEEISMSPELFVFAVSFSHVMLPASMSPLLPVLNTTSPCIFKGVFMSMSPELAVLNEVTIGADTLTSVFLFP